MESWRATVKASPPHTGSIQVTDPSGRPWQVKRRLIQLPRWRGFGKPVDGSAFVAPDAVGDSFTAFLLGVAFVIALLIATVVVWPLLVFGVELLAAALLVAARFLLGRWTVVAQTTDQRRTWSVRGRQESARFMTAVSEAIRAGSPLPS